MRIENHSQGKTISGKHTELIFNMDLPCSGEGLWPRTTRRKDNVSFLFENLISSSHSCKNQNETAKNLGTYSEESRLGWFLTFTGHTEDNISKRKWWVTELTSLSKCNHLHRLVNSKKDHKNKMGKNGRVIRSTKIGSFWETSSPTP